LFYKLTNEARSEKHLNKKILDGPRTNQVDLFVGELKYIATASGLNYLIGSVLVENDLATQRAMQVSALSSGFCILEKTNPRYNSLPYDSFHGVLGPTRGSPYSCKTVGIRCDSSGSAEASPGGYPAGCTLNHQPLCRVRDIDYVNKNNCYLVAVYPEFGDPSD
jgi:hypothetical protein